MSPRSRPSPLAAIATIAAFAVATAASTLAVAWPTPTHADGAAPLATYTVDGWKIGDVVAKGEILRDASSRGAWVIAVTARNGADHAEDVPLETDVTRLAMTPMARVIPTPQTVWSTREQVRVPAHGSITRRYALPAGLTTSIAASQAARKAPANGPVMMAPVVSFAVAFDQQQTQPGALGATKAPALAPPVAD